MRRELLALVLAPVLALAAHAATPGASLTERFDANTALIAAARKLFPESAAATVSVTRTRDLERFADGFRYETWDALDAGGKTVAELVRVQVFPDATSIIDFAVRLTDGRIVACEPVRPLMFGEKPFPHLPALLKRFSAHRVDTWATGMSLFYKGASFLDEGHAGPRAAPSPVPGAPPFMSMKQPELPLGAPLPALVGRSLAGETVDRASLAGKPVLVVLYDPRDVRSQRMLTVVTDALPRIPGCRLVPILEGTAADVTHHRERIPRAGLVLPLTIVDDKRQIPALFDASSIPYAALFGADHKLVWQSPLTTPEKVSAALERALAGVRK